MKKYGITTPNELKELCVDNGWLQEATFNQFRKVFAANNACCSVSTIALMIWMCSPDADIMDIKESLTQVHKEYEISEEG